MVMVDEVVGIGLDFHRMVLPLGSAAISASQGMGSEARVR